MCWSKEREGGEDYVLHWDGWYTLCMSHVCEHSSVMGCSLACYSLI